MDYAGLLSFLTGVTVRSLVLAAAAAAGIGIWRVKAPAARHAVWTMAVAGMLLVAALTPLLPPLPLRVWPAPKAPATAIEPPIAANPPMAALPAPLPSPAQAPPDRPFPWDGAAAVLYGVGAAFLLARLAAGYWFVVRLTRASRPAPSFAPEDIRESSWISVPMTAGWLRPRILLPAGWDTWSPAKLEAVLAHERTHIARGDWAISVLAGVNRAIFWFNPLAWWLERKLASLAEEACDDAALLHVEAGQYAEALLDMAASVKTGQGRLVWEAMAMAKVAEVRNRIERILDETRQIPRAFHRSRWIALAACSLPLIGLTAVIQLAAQEPLRPAVVAFAADAGAMEQHLKTNPSDHRVRSELVTYYYTSGSGREQRVAHIQWLVANAPESDAAVFVSQGLSPRTSVLNDASEYIRIAALWRQQAAAQSTDTRVIGNAGRFFAQAGEFDEAERLFRAGQRLDNSTFWLNRLGDLYSRAILGASGDPAFPRADAAFANRVRQQLEQSQEMLLVSIVGSRLAGIARRPASGAPLRPGELNLDDHPMLMDVVDFGNRLQTRGGSVTINGVLSSSPIVSAVPATPAPAPLNQVAPVYPPLARQARIQGVVQLALRINANGGIENLSVVSGHPLLVPATLDAVRQWRFPAGSPGSYSLQVPFMLGELPPAVPVPQGVYGGVSGGVSGGIQGGVEGGVPGPREPVLRLEALDRLQRVQEYFQQASNARQSGTSLSEALPKGPTRIRVGGNVQAANLKEKVDPEYPALARQTQIEGEVTLEVLIGEDGRVLTVNAVSGHPLLYAAARDAVRQWVYRPTMLNNTPVQVITTVTIPFSLGQ